MESCRRSDIGPVAMHAELLHLLILHSRIQYRQVLQSNCWGRQQARPIIAQRRCLSCLYQPAVALFCVQLGSSAGIATTRSASLTRRGRADFVHRGVVIRPRQQLVFQLAQEELAALC